MSDLTSIHEWAEWEAVDGNGDRFIYETKPKILHPKDKLWSLPEGGRSVFVEKIDMKDLDWKNTRKHLRRESNEK